MNVYIITVLYTVISFATLDITPELIEYQKQHGFLADFIMWDDHKKHGDTIQALFGFKLVIVLLFSLVFFVSVSFLLYAQVKGI